MKKHLGSGNGVCSEVCCPNCENTYCLTHEYESHKHPKTPTPHESWQDDFYVMWGNLNELPFILEKVEKLLLSSREEIIGVVKEILEDNRGETLWGDEASNEIMKVSLDQFILVVNEALDSHLREPLQDKENTN